MALTAEQIEEFLDKLNDDEEFRYRLVNDTVAVLEEHGIDFDPKDLVDPSEVKLPSIGEISENRDAFKEALFPDNQIRFDGPDFSLPSSAQ